MKNLFTFMAKTKTYIACVSAFLLFGFLVLPWKSAQVALYTPEGASFDTSLFYSPAEAKNRIALYNDEGRSAYIFDRWTFDLAFPLVYGVFMLSSWAFALSRLRRKTGLHPFLAVPLAAIAFDFAENISVTILMLAYPSAPVIAVYAASASTLLKWIFVGTGFAGSLVLPLAAFIVHLRKKFKRSPETQRG